MLRRRQGRLRTVRVEINTVAVDKVGQVEVQFSDRDVDVIGIDAEARMEAIGRLFQPLAVRTLQRNGFEQDDHHQIQPPNLFVFNPIELFSS